MHILLVTHAFAPIVASYSERAVALSRIFRSLGHRVTVLTLDTLRSPAAQGYSGTDAADRLAVVSTGLLGTLKRKHHLRFARALSELVVGYPGPFAPEAGLAIAEAIRLHKADAVDVVWVTTPPHELQLVGHALHTHQGVRYVMDLRDPWMESTRIRWRTRLQRITAGVAYRKCLASADVVIANTAMHRSVLTTRNASVAPDRVVCIPNGYFERDFIESELLNRPFRITYAGGNYPGTAAKLEELSLAALRTGREVNLRIAGAVPPGRGYQHLGHLSPSQALLEIGAANALFLAMPKAASSGPVMSLKAYAYARAGVPVIYWGPENETSEYLKRYTQVVPLNDVREVLCAIDGMSSSERDPRRHRVAERDSWEARMPALEGVLDRASRSARRIPSRRSLPDLD